MRKKERQPLITSSFLEWVSLKLPFISTIFQAIRNLTQWPFLPCHRKRSLIKSYPGGTHPRKPKPRQTYVFYQFLEILNVT